MARKEEPWFRFYVEAVHDRKLRRLPPELRWVWVAVLALTKRSPVRGHMMVSEAQPADVHDLADEAAVGVDTAQQALDAFTAADMLAWDRTLGAWEVLNWTKRQFDSDSSTERVRRHRARKADDDEGTEKERSSNVSVTAPDTDADTDPEIPLPPTDEFADFEEFWVIYPARDGKKVDKPKARDQWKRMTRAERIAALDAVENYAESGWRPKDAFRWLRDKQWEDWQTPANPDDDKPVKPKPVAVY